MLTKRRKINTLKISKKLGFLFAGKMAKMKMNITKNYLLMRKTRKLIIRRSALGFYAQSHLSSRFWERILKIQQFLQARIYQILRTHPMRSSLMDCLVKSRMFFPSVVEDNSSLKKLLSIFMEVDLLG